MKIKGGFEPPSNEIDKYVSIINSLLAAGTRDDFIEQLRFHTPITIEAMVSSTIYNSVLMQSLILFRSSNNLDGPVRLERCIE